MRRGRGRVKRRKIPRKHESFGVRSIAAIDAFASQPTALVACNFHFLRRTTRLSARANRNESDRPCFHDSSLPPSFPPFAFRPRFSSLITAKRSEVCRARSRQMQKIAAVKSRDRARANRGSPFKGVKLDPRSFLLVYPGKSLRHSYLRVHFRRAARLRLLIESPTPIGRVISIAAHSTVIHNRIWQIAPCFTFAILEDWDYCFWYANCNLLCKINRFIYYTFFFVLARFT